MKLVRPPHRKEKTITGVISVNSKGVGFVENPDEKQGADFEVASEVLHTALNRDTVLIKPLGQMSRFMRPLAEVTRIIKRDKMRFVGVLEEAKAGFALVPDDKRLYKDIFIPKDKNRNGKAGDKVYVEITDWQEKIGYPVGKILEVIGRHGEHNAEMKAIVLERGLAYEYPEAVIREAEAIEKKEKEITQEERAKRRDFSSVPTFTIDPIDAKDFDDAISFKELPRDLYEIGVHIADVSHYVRENTALDREARERGLSVYLVDRTIPMLPEVLSNDLCSLNPKEDKMTFSAVLKMNGDGKVSKRWFGRTVIHSNKRFTYEDANDVIIGKTDGPHKIELLKLNQIAKKLEKANSINGAVNFEKDEVKFELDKNGKPLRVYKKSRLDTHKLVEAYMLLANRAVAKFIFLSQNQNLIKKANGLKGQSVYRIHAKPDKDRITELAIFLRALGFELKNKDGEVTSKDIN